MATMDFTAPTFHRFEFSGNVGGTNAAINVLGVKAGDVVVQEFNVGENRPMLRDDRPFCIRNMILEDDYVHPYYNYFDETMTVGIIVIRDHPVTP